MSFLEPFWLLLAGGAAVPLVLHLMRRRIQLRVDFPAVRYLARAERENVRQLKMKNLLLMLLRVLAVLLLALAAARPLGALLGSGHVPTAMAIVLDNSMSTGAIVDGEPLFSRFRSAALTAVDAATGADRLWVVTADGRVAGGSRESVREAIEKTDVIASAGDLARAFSRASGLVAGGGLAARQVVVITDGQATSWPTALSAGDVAVALLTTDLAVPRNRAVVQADPRPARWTPRGTVVARAIMPDSATYRIALGGQRLSSGTARAGEDLSIHAAPQLTGWQAGIVEIEADELRVDDQRHYVVWLGAAPAVLPDVAGGPFLRTAVDALVQNQRVAIGGDVILAGADNAARLPALLLPPIDPVRLGAANRALERLGVPWRFGNAQRDETAARGDRFEGVRVSLRYPLVAQAGAVADTLATAGGRPWIVAGPRYILLGSPLDPAATDLPVHASFVPWLGDVIAQRLAGEATTVVHAVPGERIRLPVGTAGLVAPDGTVIDAGPGEMDAPARSGVYWVTRAGVAATDRTGAVVVNPEPGESELGRLPAATLQERIRGRQVVVTADESTWRGALFDAGSRRPLELPFIILALLLLAAETWVVRRTEQASALAT
ncbi:MAG: BatA domain-containing protein [Gemmatimonadota bacterium]